MSVELEDGDIARQQSFSIEMKSDAGVTTLTYSPPEGERFVVMLLGSIPDNEELTTDRLGVMLNNLGFTAKNLV